MADPADRLRLAIAELGFDEVRFVSLATKAGPGLGQWLASGFHADMQWMERTAAKRADPELVLPGARSAILLGVAYSGDKAAPPRAGPKPVWARYATQADYHDTLRPGLIGAGKLLEQFCGAGPDDYRWYTDTGPVLEREWSARAGLGFIGKNAMLISRRHGNWLFLGAILTRLELPADPPLRPRSREFAHCGSCTRCLEACPTDAFPRPGVLDARRCIAYQTIENRGLIPRELRVAIGGRVFGCDTCLEVCPWNRFAREGRKVLIAARPRAESLGWAELLRLTPEDFAAAFRGTAVKRLKLTGLLRNACVGAGNSGDPSLLPDLARLARHDSPIVRAHAVWAVRRLAGGQAPRWLAQARAAETDETVLAEYLD
jgi:epoxyqueuosine reductase